MIVCIGSINVDFIFATARWPDEHEKYRAEGYVCASGGSAPPSNFRALDGR
jgi:sugar/nucleoside kinase (ribokinase family)